MNPWDGLGATLESAQLHTSDHWGEDIGQYLDLIDGALNLPRDEPATVLDLGCGIGRLALPYFDEHPALRVIGMDSSPSMISHASRLRTEWDRVFYICNDGVTIPVIDSLDGGWSVLMFQHVPNETMLNYLLQVAGLLKPGARFLFQFVLEAEPGLLSYPRPTFVAADMVHRAGLTRIETRSGLIEPNWCWMTVEKPS